MRKPRRIWKLRSLLFVLLLATTSTTCYAVYQQELTTGKPRAKPLSVEERKKIAEQLVEMWLEAQQSDRLELLHEREDAVSKKELSNCEYLVTIKDKELGVAAGALVLCDKEKALLQDQATTYKMLYDAIKKRPNPVGCFFKALFTFGIKRCK